MGRSIGVVVLGYLVMAAVVMLALAPGMLNPDLAFAAGTLDATSAWLAYVFAVSFVAAALGGFGTSKVSRRAPERRVLALAVLVVVLGLVFAAGQQFGPPPDTSKPVAEMTAAEKRENARQPLWFAYALPFVSAAGVWLGGRRGAANRPPRAG